MSRARHRAQGDERTRHSRPRRRGRQTEETRQGPRRGVAGSGNARAAAGRATCVCVACNQNEDMCIQPGTLNRLPDLYPDYPSTVSRLSYSPRTGSLSFSAENKLPFGLAWSLELMASPSYCQARPAAFKYASNLKEI